MEQGDERLHTLIENVTDRIMQRFDNMEEILRSISPKSIKKVKFIDGERVYDNQDLCEMFDKSKRSLQRYRSSGQLGYTMEKGMTYYKQSHVDRFRVIMAEEFEQKQAEKLKQESD